MPLSYRIDRGASILRVELSGKLDPLEMQRGVDELLADPELEPGLNVLSDHSRLQEVATTALVKSVMPLLEQLGVRLGPFRCAVVASGTASFGMARMAEVYAEPSPAWVRAFLTAREAEAWLREREAD